MAEYQLIDKRTNSGKQLFRCDGCGDETPAPSKNHECPKEQLQQALDAEITEVRGQLERSKETDA